MGGGVVEGEKSLMGLVKLTRSPRQSQLVVIQRRWMLKCVSIRLCSFGPAVLMMVWWSMASRVQTPSKASEMKAPPLSEIKWTGTP